MGLCSLKGDNMKEDIKDYVERYPTYLESLDQIDQLKQQLDESFTEEDVNGLIEDRDKTIKFLQQQLAEKEKEINSLIVDYEKRISQEQELMSNMEHRLTEKQNEIDEINKEFVQSVKDWKTLCAEKDKEIEKLKQQYTILENENGKLITELIMDKYKKAQKEVSFGIQLAIQKLEEVKENLKQLEINIDNQAGFSQGYKLELKQKSLYKNVYKTIDQQIKELKGEKDE